MTNCFSRSAALFLVAVVLVALSSRGEVAAGILHHEIVLRASPDAAQIEITDRIEVSGRGSITVDVASWVSVSEISIDETVVTPNRSGHRLSVALPSRGVHVVKITAKGSIPKLDPEDASHRSGSHAIVSGDGLYLPGWSGWLPSISEDRVSYRLSVVTPAAYRSVATGELKSEELDARMNISVFEARAALEPPSVFVGPYVVTEKYAGPIRLRTYFHRSAAELAESYLEAAESFIKSYEQQIGAYPFADFHMVSAPLPVGLGFPNLTYVDRRILRLPFMRGRSLAHEVLHNWWGNGVATDYETGNWSEGLTTYMADHALADQQNPQRSKEMRLGWLRDFAALPKARDIPVSRFVSKQHDAGQVVGYGKVAFVFHMLKHEVEPDKFAAAIQRFWKQHKFSKASWQTIQAAFETETQRDLDWFFHQWVERAGAPQLRLEDVKTSTRQGGYVVDFTLAQDGPAYRLKLPVRIRTENGLEHFDVLVDGERTNVQLKLAAKPVGLHVDPDHTIFRRLRSGEAPPIMRDILLDQNAKLLVLHEDETAQQTARALVARLLNREPNTVEVDYGDHTSDAPLLVAGTAAQIDKFIVSTGLSPRPSQIVDRGTGRVWTTRNPGRKALLFVEADRSDSIRAMSRALPHYRSKSFILFEGGRALEHGVWPVSKGPLSRKLN